MGRSYTFGYILALSIIALLSIFGQIMVQISIKNQTNDAHVINLAGRQRMLSQRISLLAIAESSAESELEKLMNKWSDAHNSLVNNAFNSPVLNDKNIQERLKEIDEQRLNFLEELTKEEMIESSVIEKSEVFLANMDEVVFELDRLSTAKINLLSKIETLLFVATLITLLVEIRLIFMPISRRLKKNIESIEKSKARQKALSQKLKKTNNYLNNSLDDLKEVYQSLEKFTIMTRMDRSGVITYCNENFLDLLGYDRTDVIGRRLTDFVSQKTSYSFTNDLMRFFQNRTEWESEVYLENAEGQAVNLDVQLFQLKPTTGSLERDFIGLFQNISERVQRQKNQEIERAILTIQAQEVERKRLSQELHDGLGQMLTGVKLNLENIRNKKENIDCIGLEGLQEMVLETIQESRRVSSNLAPPVLSDFGLSYAIRNLCQKVNNQGTIKATFTQKEDIPRFNPRTEQTIFRIVQEAINNTQKHSRASQLEVILDKDGVNIHFYIKDDGIGMALDENNKKGSGLLSMRERVNLYNGRFLVKSEKSIGTQTHIVLPITELKREL